MNTVTIEQLEENLSNKKSLTFVYLYTPLCGTCKLASKMLEVIEAMEPSLEILSLNINHAPSFAQKWKIESVPCLYVFQNGLGVERVYAFHSVAHVFETIKPYLNKIKS
ncbi:thioredoxin family protein [Alkalihalobacillus trypoxylicola]|uniref:Thioredoxin n=1 Tax=Alkalihalobacillus trypoxylicola TaxID=519424 RepID=A0A162CLW9_9BACI|nr:thioredoxin family protein [Alkalihalobacillus trypoxylicola]KYG25520.1 thioredoxin [Alkalihalobacillus trypoxylicola]GAF65240.1 thioredoxin [Bacillus sp. TS-2]